MPYQSNVEYANIAFFFFIVWDLACGNFTADIQRAEFSQILWS